jgi:hypothetical protein
VCTDITPDLVLMQIRSPGQDWQTFRRSSGGELVSNGTVFSTIDEESDPFPSEERENPEILPGSEIVVFLNPVEQEEDSVSAAFELDNLDSTKWVRGDGQVTAEPCDG